MRIPSSGGSRRLRGARRPPRPLRYAIAGAGSAGRAHLLSIARIPGVVVVGIADPAPMRTWGIRGRGPSTRVFADPERMIAETRPDLVSVCTPPVHHHGLTLLSLRTGAHVVCEKPMAMDVAQAQEMARELAVAQGRVGAINFTVRNAPAVRYAREVIARGQIGVVNRVSSVYLQSFRAHPTVRWSWRSDITVAGFGSLGDLGVHVIDAVRFVTGLEFSRVVGVTQTGISEIADGAGQTVPVTTETNAAFVAELDNGAVATLETSQVAVGYGNFFRLEVAGSEGALSIDSETPDVIVFYPSASAESPSLTTEPRAEAVPESFSGGAMPASPGAIVHAIRGHVVELPTFTDGLAAQCVLESLVASGRDGSWVTVPAPDRNIDSRISAT